MNPSFIACTVVRHIKVTLRSGKELPAMLTNAGAHTGLHLEQKENDRVGYTLQ